MSRDSKGALCIAIFFVIALVLSAYTGYDYGSSVASDKYGEALYNCTEALMDHRSGPAEWSS